MASFNDINKDGNIAFVPYYLNMFNISDNSLDFNKESSKEIYEHLSSHEWSRLVEGEFQLQSLCVKDGIELLTCFMPLEYLERLAIELHKRNSHIKASIYRLINSAIEADAIMIDFEKEKKGAHNE